MKIHKTLLAILVLLSSCCIGQKIIYLNTDKTIYNRGESMWFAGLALYDSADGPLHSLFVAIIDKQQKKVLTSGRYLLVEHVAAGSLRIPDSVYDGNYLVVAYSDVYLLGKPEIIYKGNIEIRSLRGYNRHSDTTAIVTVPPNRPDSLEHLLEIILDSSSHTTRSRVHVQVRAHDREGKPLNGVCMVSVAGSRRMVNHPDIRDYFYQGRTIFDINPMPSWFGGQVRYVDLGKVKEVMPLLLTSGKATFTIKTDKHGYFGLGTDLLIEDTTRPVIVTVVDKYPRLYSIQLTNPDSLANEFLAKRHYPAVTMLSAKDLFSTQEIEQDKKMLQTVVVRSYAHEEYHGLMAMTDDPCEVWVCSLCNTYFCDAGVPFKPKIGEVYYGDPWHNPKNDILPGPPRIKPPFTKWTGCPEPTFIKKMSPILAYARFVGVDTASVFSEYATTLCYEPYLLFKNGQADCWFYTNDLLGRFVIEVNAVTSAGPAHASEKFIVKH